MEIKKGKNGLDMTFQELFPEEVKCKCGGTGRIAFVAAEETGEEEYIRDLHDNKGVGGYWLHDAAAFAVYLCAQCFNGIVRWNQA
ncbi:MAG: hypothetical protein KAS32_07620 [Candidatus Peribacteraceae bacterium]|nr:hypothetical protein [Candidatus Peribacteraceae bacterium]